MTTVNRLLSGMLLGLVATGCSSEIVTPTPVVDAGPVPAGESYVLDFTAGKYEGVLLGSGVNLAFAIELAQPVRKFAFSTGGPNKGPGVTVDNDSAGCEAKEPLDPLNPPAVGPGDTAQVDHVDLEILPVPSIDAVVIDKKLGACFAYRTPGGAWTWNFDEIPFTLDTVKSRLRVRIPIPHVPADALKVALDRNIPRHSVTTITYTVLPAATPAP
jgi:hypothetical protein